MNTKEKYEDIKLSLINEKTRDTLEKIRRATKDFTIQNDKADAYVSAVHSKLKKEKPEGLRSEDKKPEPKKTTTKPEPKPKPAPKPKPSKTAVKATTTKVNALTSALQNDPLLKGLGKTDKKRDAGRTALPAGRRVSKKGWKNQYGSSKGGRVYYENRENHSDRKSPDYKGGYPYLAMGGYTHKGDEGGEFTVSTYRIIDGKKKLIQEKKYKDSDSAVTYAMMKGNFKGIGESIIVTDKDGKWLYKSINNKSKGGYMADGGNVGRDYVEWETEVTQILADKLDIDYGDASGIVEAQPFYLQQSWTKGLSAEETADVIDEKSVMAKGGYMADGGEVKFEVDDVVYHKGHNTVGIVRIGEERGEVKTDADGNVNVSELEYYNPLKHESHKNAIVAPSTSKEIQERMLWKPFSEKTSQLEKGGYMADGRIVAYSDWDYDNPLGNFKNRQSARNFAIANMGVYDTLIFEDEYGDNIVVSENDTKQDINELFFSDFAKGGYMANGGEVKFENDYYGYSARVPYQGKVFLVEMGKNWDAPKSDIIITDGGFQMVDSNSQTFENIYMKMLKAKKDAQVPEYAKGGTLPNGKYKYEKGDKGMYEGKEVRVVKMHLGRNIYEYDVLDENGNVKTHGVASIDKFEKKFRYFPKMAKGGYMAKGEDYEYKNTFKRFDSKVPVPQDDFEKFVDAWHKQNEGDKLDKAKYKVLKRSMGNYLGHKTVQEMEDYVEKTHKRQRMAEGGKIGFDALADKVAKRYEGKKVPAKYQKEYGKTYDKQEAQDVGDKVAAKVYRQQQGKMAKGGEVKDYEKISDEVLKFLESKKGREVKVYNQFPNKYGDNTIEYVVKYNIEDKFNYDRQSIKIDFTTKRLFIPNQGYFPFKTVNDIKNIINKSAFKRDGIYAEGGKLDQGFNDRLDESMGNRNGKEAKMEATLKDRRNESKGENKAVGKRPYSSVHTMDKMAKGGKTKKYDYAELEMGIRTEKKEHGMTKAKATQTAKDHLDEDSHYYTKMKAAGLAEGGELGKINLPHNLKKYFTKPAGTIEVEMNKLIPIRAREKGIANAERYMRLAYDGKMERRKPITIYKSRNGKYRIKDGNSTYAVAKKHNWKTIWAEVVENPNISKRKENSVFTVASKIRKDGESWASAVKRAGAMNKK